MIFSCNRNVLNECIGIVQRAVSGKSSLPVLEGILIEADEVLKLTGNDLEIGIECTMDAYIEEKGSVVLNAKMLGEIVRKLSGDEILLNVSSKNNTSIKCGSSHFNISGMPGDEFTQIPQIDKENSITIAQETFKNMINKTIFAAATNDAKPVLTGCLTEFSQNELNMVAIDGFRMALRKEIIDNESGDFSFIIPAKTLSDLSKTIKQNENMIISWDSRHIVFDFDNCKVTSRLIEGEFFNYNRIIPRNHKIKITISTKKLIEAVERAALVITSDNMKSPVVMAVGMDIIKISCETQIGSSEDYIVAETIGDDIVIGFNHKYLLDALKNCDTEDVDIFLSSNIEPCIITAPSGSKSLVRDQNKSFLYMVLPIRLS